MRKPGTPSRRLHAILLLAGLAAAPASTTLSWPPGPPAAAAQPAAKPAGMAPGGQSPVRITADAAEYFNQEGLVVFAGNVVAVQEDATLTADRMEVRFSQSESAGGKPAAGLGETAAGRRITTITALKNVSFRQLDPDTKQERYATGDKGVYDAERRLVTMTGGPRLWDGKNVIAGEEMTFHLDDRKVVMSGKVNLTVYPDAAKGAKEP